MRLVEPTKQKAGMNKWIIIVAIVVILAILVFMFSDAFADARTTIALMLLTAATVYMYNRRKSHQVLSANEIARFIADTMVRDKTVLELDPSPDNVLVEESGIDRVTVQFTREMHTVTYSRTAHKIIESFPGQPMYMIHDRRQDSAFMAKRDDLAMKIEERRQALDDENVQG